jgi:hypothetical protein
MPERRIRARRIGGVVLALSVALAAMGATPVSAVPQQVASTATAPIPKVVGNKLVDSRTGAIWTAHAVNWPSFEYACQQGWAYAQDGRTAAAAQAMVSWGITAVRLPLNEDCWLGTDGSPRFGTAAGYRAVLRQFVDVLNAAGLVVILDLHWSGGTGADSDGQRAMTDDQSPLFWQQVSSAYTAVPSVMFDAFNEPYSRDSATLSWSCWADGGCSMPDVNDTTGLNGSTFTVVGMKAVVSAIRGTGATQPILLAGLDYANDLRGWLANRPTDPQLVASWHNYPGQRCQTVTCWKTEVAPVAAQVPVIATEFGETDGGTSFLTTFMGWADGQGIGYAPWAWWWTDASDGPEANAYALIQNGSFTPKAPQGTTYFQHLAALAAAGSVPAGALRSGQTLTSGSSLVAPSNGFHLDMQADGNLVEYNSAGRVIWNSRTFGNPGAHAIMQEDGNLVVYSARMTPLWSSGSSGRAGAYAVVQADGNFVVYQSGVPVFNGWADQPPAPQDIDTTPLSQWVLNTGGRLAPGDQLTHGPYRAVMQTDGNLVVYSGSTVLWSSQTYGNPGSHLDLQQDGNLVIYTATGAPVWATFSSGGTRLAMQADGNLVEYRADGSPAWHRLADTSSRIFVGTPS